MKSSVGDALEDVSTQAFVGDQLGSLHRRDPRVGRGVGEDLIMAFGQRAEFPRASPTDSARCYFFLRLIVSAVRAGMPSAFFLAQRAF